jgi:hypothetical protein
VGSGSGGAKTANTGDGADGSGNSGTVVASGSGASGVVIISYPSQYADLTSIAAGLTYTKTTSGGNKIYRFTAGTGNVSW